MKRQICFLFLFLFLTLHLLQAQSQRLILVEEFTQASCPNCALANPRFDSLLARDSAEAVSIKYQTSWPGVDPMNAQNPTDVASRVAYYGISGDPDALMDGMDYSNPSNIVQATLDHESVVTSPFTMQLVHWLNAANDSVYVSCQITCTQNATLTTPRLRMALTEKTISFATPPGSDGEKVFYNVMRKMIPAESGTALPAVWVPGQSKTISYGIKIPAYIYQQSQLATVAWIQDDASKTVIQAGFCPTASAPTVLPPVAGFTADVTSTCDGLVHFQDQSAMFPKYWLWDFGDHTTSVLQNPTHQYLSGGSFAVKLTAGNVNGTNQLIMASFETVNFSGTAPQTSNAERCGPGVVNYTATAASGGLLNWYDTTGVLVNTGTVFSSQITGVSEKYYVAEQLPNPIQSCGRVDSALGGGGGYFAANALHGLYFNVLEPCMLQTVDVYADSAGSRTIEVLNGAGLVVQSVVVSVPLGKSTVSLNFQLGIGNNYFLRLATGSLVYLYRNSGNAAYPYSSAAINITGNDANAAYYFYFYNWKVQKNPCLSMSAVVIGKDTCTAAGVQAFGYGNDLSVYPNPGTGIFVMSFQHQDAGNCLLKIVNALGQVVYTETIYSLPGNSTRQVDLSSAGEGMYYLILTGNGKQASRKIIKE